MAGRIFGNVIADAGASATVTLAQQGRAEYRKGNARAVGHHQWPADRRRHASGRVGLPHSLSGVQGNVHSCGRRGLKWGPLALMLMP